jgi:hypothetical protein
MLLLVFLLYVSATGACSLDGLYHDATGLYNLTESGTNVHIVALKGGGWPPTDGVLHRGESWQRLTIEVSFNKGADLTGEVADGCGQIAWSNDALWLAGAPPAPPSIRSIHLVYMTHLDLGFTDTTRKVCDTYFNNYFPKAFQTAQELRKRGGKEMFRWTEFPWLIQEYLDGGANCAHGRRSDAEIAAMQQAIANNDIIWHATALNFLPEVLDEDMWDYSLQMAGKLNQQFNKSWGTLCGKHTDVPGMSKSTIPALAKNGIKMYHIGYNAACAKGTRFLAPAFRWRHEEQGVMHELITLVNNNYGSEIIVRGNDGIHMAIQPFHGVPGAEDVALVFQFNADNLAPPTSAQMISSWAALAKKYPDAEIKASSLDDFAREVIQKGNLSALPVVTGELGDSWHYGAPCECLRSKFTKLNTCNTVSCCGL